MKNKINIKKVTQVLAVIFLALVGFKIYSFGISQTSSNEFKIESIDETLLTPKIQIGSKAVFDIIIADEEEEKVRGLSGYDKLEDYQGMAFFFNKLDRHGFWMKDMRFSIDIIGFDDTQTIVWLAPDLLPESFPTVFTPSRPVQYVLEVPAGSIEAFGLTLGETGSFE